MKHPGRNEKAAPLAERGPKDYLQTNRQDDTPKSGNDANALTHSAKAERLRRAAAVIARSIFSSRLSSPDVTDLEEGIRILLEDGASYHLFKADRLRKGDRVRDNVLSLFERGAAA